MGVSGWVLGWVGGCVLGGLLGFDCIHAPSKRGRYSLPLTIKTKTKPINKVQNKTFWDTTHCLLLMLFPCRKCVITYMYLGEISVTSIQYQPRFLVDLSKWCWPTPLRVTSDAVIRTSGLPAPYCTISFVPIEIKCHNIADDDFSLKTIIMNH